MLVLQIEQIHLQVPFDAQPKVDRLSPCRAVLQNLSVTFQPIDCSPGPSVSSHAHKNLESDSHGRWTMPSPAVSQATSAGFVHFLDGPTPPDVFPKYRKQSPRHLEIDLIDY